MIFTFIWISQKWLHNDNDDRIEKLWLLPLSEYHRNGFLQWDLFGCSPDTHLLAGRTGDRGDDGDDDDDDDVGDDGEYDSNGDRTNNWVILSAQWWLWWPCL